MKLFDKYQNIASCSPNRGNSVLFWAYIWVDQPMKDKFPQLFSFTRKPKCSVRFFLSQQMDRLFSPLPLSQLAATQLEEVHHILQTRNWDESLSDSWNYNWSSPRYSSKKAYNILIGSTPASPSPFQMVMELEQLGQSQILFFAPFEGQTKHKELIKEEHVSCRLQLCPL